MDDNVKSHKFTFTAGVLKRGEIRNKIKTYCFRSDIEIKLEENNDLLQSTFYYEFKGAGDKIEKLKIFLKGLENPYRPSLSEHEAKKIFQNYAKTLDEPLDEKIFIAILKIRPDSSLKNSFSEIKEAIKVLLLKQTEQSFRNALAYGYVSLGTFITKENYEKLLKQLKAVDNATKEKKEETNKFMGEVEEYINKTSKQLDDEIQGFQISTGAV